MPPSTLAARERTRGYIYAITAFSLWGVNPFFFDALGDYPAMLVVSHRIIWTSVALGLAALPLGRLGAIRAAIANRRVLLRLCASGSLIGANWTVFVWATTHSHLMEASLAYFVTPLVSVVAGVLLLRERLKPLQGLAVAIAAIGVAVLIIARGAPPWIAIGLAVTWGGYAVIRKTTPVDAFTGLLIETFLLAPLAVGYVIFLAAHGMPMFGQERAIDYVLLVNCATVTIAPLILFNAASRRLPLSTVGIINYIAPTLQFLIAVWWFGEPFTRIEAVTFGLIWISLALYTAELRRTQSLKPA